MPDFGIILYVLALALLIDDRNVLGGDAAGLVDDSHDLSGVLRKKLLCLYYNADGVVRDNGNALLEALSLDESLNVCLVLNVGRDLGDLSLSLGAGLLGCIGRA